MLELEGAAGAGALDLRRDGVQLGRQLLQGGGAHQALDGIQGGGSGGGGLFRPAGGEVFPVHGLFGAFLLFHGDIAGRGTFALFLRFPGSLLLFGAEQAVGLLGREGLQRAGAGLFGLVIGPVLPQDAVNLLLQIMGIVPRQGNHQAAAGIILFKHGDGLFVTEAGEQVAHQHLHGQNVLFAFLQDPFAVEGAFYQAACHNDSVPF